MRAMQNYVTIMHNLQAILLFCMAILSLIIILHFVTFAIRSDEELAAVAVVELAVVV